MVPAKPPTTGPPIPTSSPDTRPTLVTGAGGFLGGAIADGLLADGRSVRTLSRRPLPDLANRGVNVRRGDLCDAAAVRDACVGVGTVFHVAAVPGVSGPWRRFYEPNVLGTRHVIDGCLAAGAGRLIHTSSPSVVFDGTAHRGADESLPIASHFDSPYPATKAIAERDVRRADGAAGADGEILRTVALRPHLIWGPGDRHILPTLLGMIRRGRVPQVGRVDPRVGVTFVANAAVAHRAAERALIEGRPVGGRAYFVNDLPPVTFGDFVDRLADEAGLPRPRRVRLPEPLALAAGSAVQTVWQLLGRTDDPPLTRFAVKQLAADHWYDTTAAERDLGYSPPVGGEEAWSRTRAWLRP